MADEKKKKDATIRRRSTPVKIRDGNAYAAKVRHATKWHNRLSKIREIPAEINKNTKVENKRKELKPLVEYISKIKKPSK